MSIQNLSKENKITSRKTREFRKKCEVCGTMSKAYRMFDIDGKNLIEHLICLDCGLGSPSIK
jgi:hypothetical protein